MHVPTLSPFDPITMNPAQGMDRRRLMKLHGPDNSIQSKTSMIQIVNDDQLCMTRVIGVGLAKSCMVADETWQDIKNKKVPHQPRDPRLTLPNFKFGIQKHKTKMNRKKAGVPVNHPSSLNSGL